MRFELVAFEKIVIRATTQAPLLAAELAKTRRRSRYLTGSLAKFNQVLLK
jgi:hypothetical protein